LVTFVLGERVVVTDPFSVHFRRRGVVVGVQNKDRAWALWSVRFDKPSVAPHLFGRAALRSLDVVERVSELDDA